MPTRAAISEENLTFGYAGTGLFLGADVAKEHIAISLRVGYRFGVTGTYLSIAFRVFTFINV